MAVCSVETEKARVPPDRARGGRGKEKGNVMRKHAVVAIVLIGIAATGVAAQTLQLGIAGRVPPAVSVQLTLFQKFAVEVGLSGAGPLVASAKVYPRQLELEALPLRSFAGLRVKLTLLKPSSHYVSSQNRKPARLRFSMTLSLSLRMNSGV
jgi:hypothetical protein